MLATAAVARFRALALFVAPAVLFLGFAYHPYIGNATDDAAIASAASDNTTRWGVAHLAIGVGYALMVLAFIALRSYLSEAGEDRWSAFALPFAVLGSCLFIPLTGMEFALLAAAETGGDVQAVQEELTPWFIPLLISGALCTGVGAAFFAVAVARSSVLTPLMTRIVVAGFVVYALARIVPLGFAQIVLGLAAIVALWPIASRMWIAADALSATGDVVAPQAPNTPR